MFPGEQEPVPDTSLPGIGRSDSFRMVINKKHGLLLLPRTAASPALIPCCRIWGAHTRILLIPVTN